MSVVGGFSPSPGARTFAELKNEVARYVKMPNDVEALSVCGDAVYDGIRYYNTKTWRFNLVYQDINLVVSTFDYDLSEAVKEPRHVEVLDTNSKVVNRLSYLDPKTFLSECYPSTGDGSPCRYTLMNTHEFGTLTVDVAPTAAYIAMYPTIRFWYFRRIQNPAGDSDPIAVPSEIEGGILWKAREYVAQIYVPDKWKLAAAEHSGRWKLLRADNSDESHDWEG